MSNAINCDDINRALKLLNFVCEKNKLMCSSHSNTEILKWPPHYMRISITPISSEGFFFWYNEFQTISHRIETNWWFVSLLYWIYSQTGNKIRKICQREWSFVLIRGVHIRLSEKSNKYYYWYVSIILTISTHYFWQLETWFASCVVVFCCDS